MPQISAVNWTEVVAVWRPQIWRDEHTAVGFIQCNTASLHTSQTKTAVCNVHCTRLAEIRLSRVKTPGLSAFLAKCQFFHSSYIVFMVFIFIMILRLHTLARHCHAFSQCFMFLAPCIESSFVQFYPEIQPVTCKTISFKMGSIKQLTL